MDSEGVLLPWIDEHRMIPVNDMRKGDCCGRFEANTDGYYCQSCDFFVHKKCGDESEESILHLSHPDHTLKLLNKQSTWLRQSTRSRGFHCNLCGNWLKKLFYNCDICKFDIDLWCAKYPPPDVIDISETHHHKLTLFKERITFDCAAKCDNRDVGFPYKCYECDLDFHIDCVWHPSDVHHPLEVNHAYHCLHPLKFHAKSQLPDYSDGTCRLCARKIFDNFFYHCSLCNFTLDVRCVLNPPLQSLLNLKVHDHQLTLLPILDSFTCKACGLKGDRSPYVCFQCGFMIHQDCFNLPRVININRHDHRVYRTSVLGVVNSVCKVCWKKLDWTCGGFACQTCYGFVVHSRCATRWDVWNKKELEGIPEEIEDIEPYEVIDDNTIEHFSHKEHHLRLHINDDLCEDNKRCQACTHPISFQSFYSCIDCDFILHQSCAGLPKKKRHFLHKERLTLVTNKTDLFFCRACGKACNGFRYVDKAKKFDVLCVSISEPFSHPSHPDHLLYYNNEEARLCNGCGKMSVKDYLRCIEDDCRFILCFACITLPHVVKHRIDDHPLSLCYGEKESGTYWCDICEEKSDPKRWFYTCKDLRGIMHLECVYGDFSNFMPRRIARGDHEVVLNNSVSRPICSKCKLHCIYPIVLKNPVLNKYYCSAKCSKGSLVFWLTSSMWC